MTEISFMTDPNETHPTYIYFLGCNGHTKVGVATNLENRITHLQICNPYKLKLRAQYGPIPRKEAYATETAMHLLLAKSKVRGEWFRWSAPLKTMIARARKGQHPLPATYVGRPVDAGGYVVEEDRLV